MINTSSTLSPDLFGDGDPFTIDFWYKPLVVIDACSVGHEWYNGIFYFGIAGDASDLGLFFATQRGAYGSKVSDAIIGRWYHIAMVRVNYTLYGFADHRLNQLIQPTVSRIYNFVFDQTTSLTKFLLKVYCLRKCLFKVYTY